MLLENHESRLVKVASQNKDVMTRLLKVVNDKILEKLEIERRRQGNIKVTFYLIIYLKFVLFVEFAST